MAKIFTVRIFDLDGILAIQGPSKPGETWEAALMRLHGLTIKDDGVRVFVRPQYGPFEDLSATGSGKGVAVLYRRGGESVDASYQQEYVTYETDPPQF